MSDEPLILASSSPRRKQLLEMLGIPVIVRPSHIPEVHEAGETPSVYARRLARDKAGNIAQALAGRDEYAGRPLRVLGADTTVVLDGQLLEKPVDAADALRMLRMLQGRTHEVVTAVALVVDGRVLDRLDVTHVTFRPAADDYLRAYIATGEPMDKAGSYGIQGFGASLVERIEGDFFSVMGLPVRYVLEMLQESGTPYRFGETLR